MVARAPTQRASRVEKRQHGDRFVNLMDKHLPQWRHHRRVLNEEKRPCALVFQQEDGVHIKLVTNEEARELSGLVITKPS